jgi:cytoplasmic iron level regulating protein YaaA (DUF328/UPF0246 family)
MSMPLFLLPPSEGKNGGGRTKRQPDRFKTPLAQPRQLVLEALAKMLESESDDVLQKRFKARNDLFSRAVEASNALVKGTAKYLPAWQRYSGVVWEHLDPATLASEARKRILVPSAIYGLTSADDMIADYRLTMNVSLPGIGNLASFWRAPITEVVSSVAQRAQVVNLLPNEHANAIELSKIAHVIHVGFVQDDKQRAVGHFAKAAKGHFARHLIDHGVDAALSFSMTGWVVEATETGFLLVACD